ncbi:MAG: dicarboxylate/amino acid:cation symporter [Gammaproteobacteria bacterium]
MPHKHAIILLIAIVFGVIAGVASGWIWGEAMVQIKWMGDLFLHALKLVIVPLIVAAVISGVCSLGDVRKLGRIGGITVLYYASTTAIAVLIGLLVVNLIQPGVGMTELSQTIPEKVSGKEDMGFSQIITSLVKPNLIEAGRSNQLLPIIFFCLLFAAALTTVGEKGKPVIAFFDGLNEAMMKVVIWIMYFAPFGIFALIAARLGMAGGGEAFLQEIKAVGLHVVTVLTGLTLHFIVLLTILWLFAGRGLAYLTGMGRALLTAFGTASSSATIPLTMECARENGIDPRATRFVIPLGATINMDGTALYESAAVMFIAQAYGIDMSISQQAIIFVTATLAAIGAAGIPEAGLVTMVIVLSAVNLPLEGIGLLLAVDWFLDRFRTSINVWGDSVGAAVIDRVITRN